MSSGKQTTVSSTELPGWMQPYAKNYLSQAETIASKPYQAYDGQTVAGMDPRTQQGLNMQANMARAGSGLYNSANDTLQGTVQGEGYRPAATNANAGAANPYAGSNPYLQSQIDQAQGDVVRNYNMVTKPQTESAMVNSGSFGNSGLQQVQQQQQSNLVRGLGDISSNMRFQDYGLQAQLGENATNRLFNAGESQAGRDQGGYQFERSNQLNASQYAPAFAAARYNDAERLTQAGQPFQQQQQLQLSDAYQKWQEAQGYDAQQLGVLGNALGTVRGNQTSQTGPSGPSTSQTMGQLASAAALAYIFSDKRLKTDIKKVGETDEGLGVYTYKYKWGGPTQMGVLAQEVEKKKPEAVANVGGFRAVNYGLLK
jgi:hypothetical protein